MALPSSGQIGLSDVRTELSANQTNFSLSGSQTGLFGVINNASTSHPDSIAPYAMSEWYGYDNSASTGFTISWQYTKNTVDSGGLFVDVNTGTQTYNVIFATTTSSGTIVVQPGWILSITAQSNVSTGVAVCTLGVFDNSVQINNNTTYTVTGLTSNTFAYTVTGNGSITSTSFKNPVSSTLTYSSYDSGVGFHFTLSSAIPSKSFLVDASARGYGSSLCGRTPLQTATGTTVFNAGATTATGLGNLDFCLVSTYYNRGTSVTVTISGNPGVSLTNGQTITIDGTVVTLALSSNCNLSICA
jgi:hypothetical protein